MKHRLSIPNLVLLVGCLTGCGGGDSPPTVEEGAVLASPQTPEQALANVQAALGRADRDGLRAQWDVDEADQPRVDAMVALLIESRRFRETMVEKFGRQGWDEFNDAEGARLTLDTPLTATRPAGWSIKTTVDGGSATATVGGRSVTLVRRDGVWRVRAVSLLPPTPGERVAVQEKLLRALSDIVTDGDLSIGEADVTPQTLDRTMGRRFLAAMEEAKAGQTDVPPVIDGVKPPS